MFAEHVLHEVGTNRQEKSLCGYWRNVALCQEIVQVQPMSGKECDLSLTWIWVMMVMMTTIMARK